MAPAEKPTVAVATARLSDVESFQPEADHTKKNPTNWRPGYFARFPWFGAVGLIGALICAVVVVVVLVCSNGASKTWWRLQPSIIISGLTGLSNLCLALAIAEGIAIAWWRKALKGATVAQLHESWALSMSFRNVLQHFWRMDVIALAALAAKIAILDGILFQRASTTYTTQDPAQNITLVGAAAKAFPQTGYVVAQGFGAQTDCNCFMIGDTYTPTVDTWETSNGFFKDFDELFPVCDGICYSYVDAIGFEIDCQKSTNHTNYATGAINAYQLTGGKGDASQWTDLPIFNSSFGVMYPSATTQYSSLALDLLYFDSENPYNPNSDSCPGTITNVQCTLRPALIRYPLTIVNYTNTHITNGVSIGGRPHDDSNTASPPTPAYSYSNKQAEGFTVLSYLNSSDQNIINSTTQLGGIANALGQFMSSSATITYNGGSLWSLTQKGILAQSMMFGPPNMGSCDCSFRDALSTLVSGINQLTFLTATSLIARPNSTNTTIRAGTVATVIGITSNTTTTYTSLPNSLQIRDAIHYHTNYLFVGLGLASVLGCILLIIPSFWRYGELGRQVTLGPMEIASAFRAPMLETGVAGKKAAGNLEELIKQVGDRKVVYGFVEEEDHAAADGGLVEKRETLCMEAPTRVRPVSNAFSSTTPPMSPRTPMSPMSPTHSRRSGGRI